jgi:uncharacterized protein (TIGR02217 family)
MGWWLAAQRNGQDSSFIKRFDPRFWTVNFPRPMMAGATTPAPDALRVDAVFYRANDLAGLIWEVVDRYDHPLLAYETSHDFRGNVLSFQWQSSGILPLDVPNGPTLTIEGRDASGTARTWYVRLWNYASGSPTNATIRLDFDALAEGYTPGGAPVYTGDIDRIFMSLVPTGFTNTDAPLASPQEAWVTLTGMVSDGAGSVLEVGDVLLPPHSLSIAAGYDDAYNQTPARLLRNAFALGYRGDINHYVGMSHYFRLEASGGGYYVSLAGGALNVAAAAWHADFAAKAKALGLGLIISLSYELFDQHCWNDWKQRAWDGSPALTGYVPPSALLSPAHAGATGYLQQVAKAFVSIAATAGQVPKCQVGEPWWWVMADGRPCLYDAAAQAALGGTPVNIPSVRSSTLNAAQKALLDRAGALLAASTAALTAAVKAQTPACQTLLLTFLPTNLDPAAPELRRANLPVGWASPAFDILQLEDYDWVTAGNAGASAAGVAAATARLGYLPAKQHYFAGFVTAAANAQTQWGQIERAARVAQARGVAATFIWALPQVTRDGFTVFDEEAAQVQAFDDLSFPLAIGKRASVQPNFSTAIVTTASGYEQRNADWAQGRIHFDAGPGVRSEADLETLIAFFRARRGAARGFRFRDPYDYSSNGMTGAPTATDQIIGIGDGSTTHFPLIKHYGAGPEPEVRLITRPVAVSLLVAVNGVTTSAWTLDAAGAINFTTAPPSGQAVTAGFLFDVPVRFAEDKLTVDVNNFQAGEVPSVPLVEIREG